MTELGLVSALEVNWTQIAETFKTGRALIEVGAQGGMCTNGRVPEAGWQL